MEPLTTTMDDVITGRAPSISSAGRGSTGAREAGTSSAAARAGRCWPTCCSPSVRRPGASSPRCCSPRPTTRLGPCAGAWPRSAAGWATTAAVDGDPVVLELADGAVVDVDVVTAGAGRTPSSCPGSAPTCWRAWGFGAPPAFETWLLAAAAAGRRRASEAMLHEAALGSMSQATLDAAIGYAVARRRDEPARREPPGTADPAVPARRRRRGRRAPVRGVHRAVPQASSATAPGPACRRRRGARRDGAAGGHRRGDRGRGDRGRVGGDRGRRGRGRASVAPHRATPARRRRRGRTAARRARGSRSPRRSSTRCAAWTRRAWRCSARPTRSRRRTACVAAAAQARAELGYVDFLRGRYDRAEGGSPTRCALRATTAVAGEGPDLPGLRGERSGQLLARPRPCWGRRRAVAGGGRPAPGGVRTGHARPGQPAPRRAGPGRRRSSTSRSRWPSATTGWRSCRWPQALRGEVQLATVDPAGAERLSGRPSPGPASSAIRAGRGSSARGLALVAEAAGDPDAVAGAFELLADARPQARPGGRPVRLARRLHPRRAVRARPAARPSRHRRSWVETLRELASRTGMRELTVRSLLHGAALGNGGRRRGGRAARARVGQP